jgi:hypothetical protein
LTVDAGTIETARRSFRYELHSRASAKRWYVAYARASRHRSEAAGPATALVIDGFPRSANTFATVAFQVAQSQPVRLGHHLHAPAHLLGAVDAGVPALALIRDPVGAVVSEAIREGPVGLRTVLSAYCRFYETLLPVVDRVTVGRFDVVTTDLGTVIDQVNRRFGTRFERFEHTPEDVELVFRLIDERERRPDEKTVDRFLSGELTLPLALDRIAELDRRRTPTVRAEHAVPRPSRERESSATALRAELEDPALAEPLRRARALYERLASASMS